MSDENEKKDTLEIKNELPAGESHEHASENEEGVGGEAIVIDEPEIVNRQTADKPSEATNEPASEPSKAEDKLKSEAVTEKVPAIKPDEDKPAAEAAPKESGANKAEEKELVEDEAAEKWRSLLAVYERDMENITDQRERASVLYVMGEINEYHLGESEKALKFYQQAFETDPAYVPPIKAAVRLFEEVENYEMVSYLLGMLENAALNDEEKVACLIERARIRLFHLDQNDEAEKELTEAKKLAPQNEFIQKLLEQVYLKKRDEKAISAFYSELANSGTGGARIDAMINHGREISRIRERAGEAALIFEKALELEENNATAMAALSALYTRYGRWQDLARIVERVISNSPDAEIPPLCYIAGKIWRDELSNPGAALGFFQRGLEKNPTDQQLLRELVATLEPDNDYASLKDAYCKLLAGLRSDEQKLDVLIKVAALCEDKLGQQDEALAFYQQIIEISPDYLPAVTRVARIYAKQGQWEKLAVLTVKEAERLEEPKLKAARYVRAAEIYNENLNDVENAVANYRKAVELMPDYLPAIRELAAIYEKTGAAEALIEINEKEIALTKNKEHLVYLLHMNAEIWLSRLSNKEEAYECYKRAHEIDKENLTTIQALGKVLGQLDKYEELVEINLLEAQLVSDQRRMLSLLFKNAQICQNRLNDSERALKFYQQVLAISPDYVPALRATGAIYIKERRWGDLLSLYRQELRASKEKAQRERLLFRIGAILEEELNDADGAIKEYEAVIESNPSSLAALLALTRLYEKKRSPSKLAELYSKLASLSSDAETVVYYVYKTGELYESMGELEAAEGAYKRCLELKPGNKQATKALHKIFLMTNRVKETLPLLDSQIESSASDLEKIELLAQKAEIFESEQGREEETIKTYEEIIALDGANMHALRQLERLYQKTDQFFKLKPVYETRVRLAKDEKTKALYLWLLINVKLQYFSDMDLTDDFEELIRLNPTDLRAMDRLAVLYIERKEWQKLVKLYGDAAENSFAVNDKVYFLTQLAQLYEIAIEDAALAEKIYKKILELNDRNVPAISALKRCYTKSENWSELIAALQKELDVTLSEKKKAAIYYQLGFIYETKLGAAKEAINYYKNALNIKRSHEEAYARLKELFAREGAWDELMTLHQTKLKTLQAPRLIASVYFEMAKIAEEKMNDPAKAYLYMNYALQEEPTNKDFIWKAAAIAMSLGKWNEAEGMFYRISPLIEDRDEMAAMYKSLAALYETKLANVPKAIWALEELLALGEKEPAFKEKLAELFAADNRHLDAIATYRSLAQSDGLTPEKSAEYNLKIGRIYSEKLNEPEKGASYYEKAMNAAPADEKIFELVSESFNKNKEWDKLVGALRQRLERTQDDELKIKLTLEIAKIYSEKKADINAAEAAVATGLQNFPDSIPLQKEMASILSSTPSKQNEALVLLRNLQSRNPFDAEIYNRLHSVFMSLNRRDEAFVAASAAVYFKGASKAAAEMHANLSNVPRLEAVLLTEEAIGKNLLSEGEKTYVSELLKIVSQAYYKAYPVDLTRFDLSAYQRLPLSHQFAQTTESVGFHLGVERCDVYVSKENPDAFATIPTKPGTIIIGSALAFAHEKLRNFFVGVAVSRFARGHMFNAGMSADELRKIIDAVALFYLPGLPSGGFDLRELDAIGKNIAKNVNKNHKKQLETLVRQWASSKDKQDLALWQKAADETDMRMGMASSGDIAASIRGLFIINGYEYHEPHNQEEAAKTLGPYQSAKDLLAYMASDEYFALRKSARIAL